MPTTGLTINPVDYSTNRTYSSYETLLSSIEMSLELAIIDNVDAIKELLREDSNIEEATAKVENLLKVGHYTERATLYRIFSDPRTDI